MTVEADAGDDELCEQPSCDRHPPAPLSFCSSDCVDEVRRERQYTPKFVRDEVVDPTSAQKSPE